MARVELATQEGKKRFCKGITNFIINALEEHGFMGIGLEGEDIEPMWRIYTECEPEETSYEDLNYQSPGDTLDILTYIDMHPELEDEDWKVVVENWINFLYDNDYIYA